MTRYDRLLDDLLKKHRHASEQQILACLDGELSARQSEWVRRHLEGCWRCRSLSEQIGQTVGGFIEYRQQYLTSTAKNSNEGWPALKARLRQSSPPRPRSLPSRFLAVPALAVLALAFFYLRLSSTEPVSAATALGKRQTLRAGRDVAERVSVLQEVGNPSALRRGGGTDRNLRSLGGWPDKPGKALRFGAVVGGG